MNLATSALCVLSAVPNAAAVQDPAPETAPYPASTALAEGVSPDALAGLDRLVQGFVDDGEVVGAELLVVKNGRAILHEAYGWRDRESETPMEPGSVFCVRSMTKPLIGAALLMLIEDGRIDLDDRVARYLPAFDAEATREVTVEHLLTHTSGLPMSLILGRKLDELESIRAVAELGGGRALEFEPGTAFEYSDQGTDTLTALIEVVTGAPAADFVRERVLEPLGMRDSACVMAEGHPLRARACSKYAGSTGAWTRFWSPAEPPLFPFFLGSQGLYSTTTDYARFLELWLRKGRPGSERLLRPRSVRRALEPGPHPARGASGFPDMRADYGALMQLWTRAGAEGEDDGGREVVVFGHTGSDGTHAWAFPEARAMVLYFTQSRGTLTGLRVEERLAELFLGATFDPRQAAPPLEPYLGYYWEGEGDLYRAIVRDGDDLALEIVGRAVVPLIYAGDDRWKLQPSPSTVLAFERDEDGAVTGYRIDDHHELRFEPSADLPAAADVAERVARAHRVDRIETVGPLRGRSRLTIERLGVDGEVTSWLAWPDRWRVDEAAGGETGRAAFDGTAVRSAAGGEEATVLEGPSADAMRRDSPFVRFGDWRAAFPRLQVVQRLGVGDEEVLLVRAGDASAPAPTFFVDAESGRLVRIADVAHLERMGRVGRRITFREFHDVSGVLLPRRTEVEIAGSLIGTIVLTAVEVEAGVELPAGLFELGD